MSVHTSSDNNNPTKLAAIDLGSNSFHLVIARLEQGELRPIERLGEKVQLAAGLKGGQLQPDAIERGLDCLRRFQQLLSEVSDCPVRVVATNALRAAHNREEFIAPAEQILGCPVEVIAGREEARLVYLGVAHTLADDDDSRLVIDIGGGSTELIVGNRFEANLTESLHMGCVSYRRFFIDGVISRDYFSQAYRSAYLELLNIRSSYLDQWQHCVGSSGTLMAIEQVLIGLGISRMGISPEGLQQLQERVLEFEHIDDVRFPGLKDSRRHVFVSGLAITMALFDALEIDHMELSDGALREGVLYDYLGRLSHEDVRERSVSALEQRYDTDRDQAERVSRVVEQLFEQLQVVWQLQEQDLQQLQWAARLHTLGLTVSHSQFQKHGEYLLRYADLAGFARHEQEFLAALVRAHRRKFPVDLYQQMRKGERQRWLRCALMLRLAVLLRYTSLVDGLPNFTVSASKKARLAIRFPDGWLEQHPLTQLDLEQECRYLRDVGFELVVS